MLEHAEHTDALRGCLLSIMYWHQVRASSSCADTPPPLSCHSLHSRDTLSYLCPRRLRLLGGSHDAPLPRRGALPPRRDDDFLACCTARIARILSTVACFLALATLLAFAACAACLLGCFRFGGLLAGGDGSTDGEGSAAPLRLALRFSRS